MTITKGKVILIVIAAFISIGLISMLVDRLTDTITENTLKADSQYRDYQFTELSKVEYVNPPTYQLEFSPRKYTIGYEGIEIPVKILRKGYSYSLYNKGLKRVYVKKEEFIEYPECVVFPQRELITPSPVDVEITYGNNRKNIQLNVSYFKSEGRYNYYCSKLIIDKQTFQAIKAAKTDVTFYSENNQIGTIAFSEVSSINEVSSSDADSYLMSFTKENLDDAYRYYVNEKNEQKSREIKELIALTEKYKNFYWNYDQMTENPHGQEELGMVLDELKILYWTNENVLVFGKTVHEGGSKSNIKVYKKTSILLPDVRVHMNNTGAAKDEIIGMVDINHHKINPTQTKINQWIVGYVDRKPITRDNRTIYVPRFKLIKIVK
ncbi:MAG TPA: hypothetical protein PKK43_14270 [Spirochaetota bacterium]|nr:hypothetical protein [Spirochaetota bacterium]